MLRGARRVGRAARRIASPVGQAYIEYAVSSESEQRHGCQPGGSLTVAVQIVVLAHGRSLNAGGRVRITLWEAPQAKHVKSAREAAKAHGFKLELVEGRPQVFVVEKASAGVEQEVVHLLAS